MRFVRPRHLRPVQRVTNLPFTTAILSFLGMDDLDRMYRRLVQNLRAGFPDLLARPFEVSELYTTLIPYRHNRRELGFETNQDYELALLRLLSGERGYLIGDPQMQEDLRDEIQSPNPDLSKFRAYSTSMVSLAPEGARSVEPPVVRRPGSGGTAAIGAAPAAPSAAAAMAERPTIGVPEHLERPTVSGQRPAAPPPAAPAPAPAPVVPAPVTPPPQLSATGGRSIVASGTCRYCNGELPEGRNITFCPHCGQNLTVQNCPACGTELDVGWKFCTTCGRATA
jgi:hypothetical protein